MPRAAAVAIIACVLGCQPSTARFATQTAPLIRSFTVTPAEISEGETVQILADYDDGTATVAGVGTVAAGVATATVASLAPLLDKGTATYVLTVTNSAGVVSSAEASITVYRAPAAFAIAAPSRGEVGQLLSASVSSQPGITFSWQVSGASLVSASSGESILLALVHLSDVTLGCVATNALGRSTSAQLAIPVVGVERIAGDDSELGDLDATGSAARFDNLGGVTDDTTGGAYVSDTGNQVIRHVDAAGVVTTIAGTPQTSGSQEGASAKFSQPLGLTRLPSGDLIVADFGNKALRRITVDGITSTAISLANAQPLAIAAAADGTFLLTALRADGVALTRLSASFAALQDIVTAWPQNQSSFAVGATASEIIAGDGLQAELDHLSPGVDGYTVQVLAGHVPNAIGLPSTYGVFYQGPGSVLSDGQGGAYTVDEGRDPATFAGLGTRLLHVASDGTVTVIFGSGGELAFQTAAPPNAILLAPADATHAWMVSPSAVMRVRAP